MSDAHDPENLWSAPGGSSNEDAAGNSPSNNRNDENYSSPAGSWGQNSQERSSHNQYEQPGYQQGGQAGNQQYGQNQSSQYGAQYGQYGYGAQPGNQQYGQSGYQQYGQQGDQSGYGQYGQQDGQSGYGQGPVQPYGQNQVDQYGQSGYGQDLNHQYGYQQGGYQQYDQQYGQQGGYQQYGQQYGSQQYGQQGGYQQYGQSGYQQGGYQQPMGGYQQPMTYGQVKPGIVPIRPLGVGDIIGGAFSLIRFNPQATVGFTLIVALVAGLLSFGVGALLDLFSPTGVIGALGITSVSLLTGVISSFLVGLLMGPLTIVTVEAVKGNKISPQGAWQIFHPNVWKYALYYLLVFVAGVVASVLVILFGTALLSASDSGWTVAIFLLMILAFILGMVYVYIKLIVAMPIVANEGVGPIGAITRSWKLTNGFFWRIFGTFLLTTIIIQFLAAVVTVPIGLITGVGGLITGTRAGVSGAMMVGDLIVQIISLLISAPLSAALVALIYVNQRIRKEGFDIEILGNLNR